MTRVAVALVLLALTACDKPAPQTDLLYDGKIVHPSCFARVAGFSDDPSDSVNLKACSAPAPAPLARDKNGFYRQPQGEGAYIGYKYVGRVDAGEVVLIVWSGGGSGEFSELAVFAHEGDALRRVRMLGGGDRCTGIGDAEVKDGKAVYRQGLTPADLATLDMDSAEDALQAGEGLESCMACCIADLQYVDGTPVSVSFNKDWESGTTDVRQKCFEEQWAARIGKNRPATPFAEMLDFAASVRQACPGESAP